MHCAVWLASMGKRYYGVLGRGKPDSGEALKFWKGHIERGSELVHDGEKSHIAVCDALGLKSETFKTTEKGHLKGLQKINNNCSFINLYFVQHPGISRDRLGLYLAMLSKLWENTGGRFYKVFSDFESDCIIKSEYSGRKAIYSL